MQHTFSLKHFLLVSSLALGLPLPARAQMPPGPDLPPPQHRLAGADCRPGMPHGEALPPFLAGVLLNEAQQDKLFELMHGQAKKRRELGKALIKADAALAELGLSPAYDEAKARGLAQRKAEALAELTLLQVRSEHQIYELLTPEQRQALASRQQDGPGRDGPGREAGPRSGPEGHHPGPRGPESR